jgi:hypothetical protein
LLAPAQAAGSSSSSSSGSQQRDLSALLAAAAVGTAPEGGVVSEAQQAITVTEVPLQGDTAAAGSGDGDSAAAVPAAAVEFVRVSEPTASLSFGGWQVTGEEGGVGHFGGEGGMCHSCRCVGWHSDEGLLMWLDVAGSSMTGVCKSCATHPAGVAVLPLPCPVLL